MRHSLDRLTRNDFEQFKLAGDKMDIRLADAQEMLALWEYSDIPKISPTARFFSDNISLGNTEFWTIDHDDELIGELYVFKNLEDKDFADGKSRAYLAAFRVREDYRGRGLGSQLMNTVFEHLKEIGFETATIGVDETEEHNIQLYQRLGFNSKIKNCTTDPCAMDNEMRPKKCSCFWLLKKQL